MCDFPSLSKCYQKHTSMNIPMCTDTDTGFDALCFQYVFCTPICHQAIISGLRGLKTVNTKNVACLQYFYLFPATTFLTFLTDSSIYNKSLLSPRRVSTSSSQSPSASSLCLTSWDVHICLLPPLHCLPVTSLNYSVQQIKVMIIITAPFWGFCLSLWLPGQEDK